MNKLTAMIICILAVLPARLWAGSAGADDNSFEPERITSFAKSVEHYAAKQGARAFIIARIGRAEDELPEGIQFTHAAVAIYSSITLDNGDTAKGYAIHNLYQTGEGSNRSELITDYPTDFFWSAKSLKAGIIIPTAELQQQLVELVARGDAAKVHNPRYSAIANPFNSRYQNCTEYTLDLINAAIYQSTDIEQLKANARAHFTPQKIYESRLKIALGSLLMKEVSSKDHKGAIATATFTTIARYLDDNGLMRSGVVLNESGEVNALF